LGLNATRELAWAVDAAQRTNNLRLDEGRTTWRAARLLWRGENPYGIGVIVDDTGFERRLARRQGLGIGPAMPASAVGPALERYLSSLDPDQRIALLPDVSGAPLAVRWEAAVVGYKYGPVPLLITAALERRLGSMSVPLSNGLACLLLFGVVALIVRSAGADWLVAGAVVAASLLDPIMVWFFVQLTATDVWPLLFGFTAVLAVMWRWPTVAGIAVTLAVASKIMPGALFLLLLPIMRSWRALATCVVTGLVLVLPWIAWDPMGFICNFALWGLSMDPDVNSWVSSAPAWLVPIVRSILVMAILALSCMLALHRLARMCAGFAAITILVLAGGSAFHNNYVPWVTIWMMLAIVEALHIPGAISMRLMGAQPSAMAEPGAPIVGR